MMEGPEVEVWKGCLENYTFRSIGNTTNLIVDIETVPDYRSYFKDTWPKALNILKFLCEK
jgi:hypothetical protein